MKDATRLSVVLAVWNDEFIGLNYPTQNPDYLADITC